jgi:hypothetical protein
MWAITELSYLLRETVSAREAGIMSYTSISTHTQPCTKRCITVDLRTWNQWFINLKSETESFRIVAVQFLGFLSENTIGSYFLSTCCNELSGFKVQIFSCVWYWVNQTILEIKILEKEICFNCSIVLFYILGLVHEAWLKKVQGKTKTYHLNYSAGLSRWRI